MLKTNNYKSSGKSALFLILAIIVIIIIALVVVATVLMSSREQEEAIEIVKEEIPEPVYEVVVGNIKFTFIEAKDRGSVLRCEERTSPPSNCRPQDNLETTDKFVEIEITAQNVGRDDLRKGSWSIEELVDSEGRMFYSAGARRWVPEESQCGALLKPGFTPTSCTEIYAVAERSIGLKVKVSGEKEAFLDLDLYHEKYCWDDSDCGCGINKYTNNCFVGNKVYVADLNPLIFPQELIEECNDFCAVGTEELKAKCIENECGLY
jgi:hypothetical protein